MVPLDELEEQGKRPWVRRVLMLVPALAFIGLLAFGLLKSAPPQMSPGAEAPTFNLPLLEGEGTLSSEDLRGRPVVLNFWASWCIPCQEEAPLLERAWREYRDRGVVFVGVNIKDARSDAKRFVDEFNITYPIVRDEREELARMLGVYGIPETFFIDHEWSFLATIAGSQQAERQGTVVLGAITEDQLFGNLEILVRGADASQGGEP